MYFCTYLNDLMILKIHHYFKTNLKYLLYNKLGKLEYLTKHSCC